ncbi:AMP-binding protein [Streptomyces sp. WAC07061]|uniref:AMP-binding protein n=1 Tax=Streptomyces sp. WAC07061 TaxID=2487410 RepID=UPI0021AF4CEC|nr:AMP-binding protein [Streptomyces sp. WAC07061]
MASMLEGRTPWPQAFVDRYWAAGHWGGSTLDNLLRGWALQYGPRTALVHGGTRLTYANLNRRVDRMAAGFRLRGLRPGMRVVVQLPNVPEFVVGTFALMRAGVVPVLCPLPRPDVPELVRVTQAVGYVGPAEYRGFDHMAMAADTAARRPFLRRVFTYEPPGTGSPYGGMTTDASNCQYAPLGSVDAAPEPALPPDAGRVAFLLVSDGDGAGGGPVLVPRTHNDFAYQARAAAELVSLTEDDVYLAALPAASAFALGCPGIIGTLTAGGTVVLADGPDPAACLPLVERERVTVTSLPPDAAAAWLDALPSAGTDVSTLRLVQSGGGAPLPRATAERLASRLGARPQQVFAPPGGPVVLTRPTDPDETVYDTQGRPLSPDDEIRLVGADGRGVPDGEPGELLARGPYIPRGHYRPAGDGAGRFTPDGFLRTGVLARRTADGDLVVTGRAEDTPTG